MPQVNSGGDPDNLRLNAEWLGINALRELLFIAKGTGNPTYQEALELGSILAPNLYGIESSLIAGAQEPPLAKEYRQRAAAQLKINNKIMDPLTLIENEIEEYKTLIKVKVEKDQLKKKLNKLYQAREYFLKRPWTETQILVHDVFTADRPDLPGPFSNGRNYKEYALKEGYGFKIRLLHPDRAEQATGADLIYEVCDPLNRQVRLALIQYKLWDGKVLYFSKTKNLLDQLYRLVALACNGKPCLCEEASSPRERYRLPYCAAFLRPTDRLQSPASKLVSTGFHVPVCEIDRFPGKNDGAPILRKKDAEWYSLNHLVFEELFRKGKVGSRWIPYDQVELLYRDNNILESDEHIIVHIQEYPIEPTN